MILNSFLKTCIRDFVKVVKFRKKEGFTIIEALVSFFITVLLISLLFNFSLNFYSSLSQRSFHNKIFMENFSAMDHIFRNISQAPMDAKNWLVFSQKHIVWRDTGAKLDFGYELKEGPENKIDNNGTNKGLYFLVGNYGVDGWVKKRSNLMSKSIDSIKFSKEMSFSGQEVKAVGCNIKFLVSDTIGMKNISRVIFLKNRVITG